MSRMRIELPTAWKFSTEIPVRVTDVNYGGHVGNDSIVGLFHEARVRWLKEFGWTELLAPPVGLIMVDLAVRFKHEAGYGDVLTIRLTPLEITERGFDLVYQMAKPDGREVARAWTRLVYFDYSARKLADAPAGFVEKIR